MYIYYAFDGRENRIIKSDTLDTLINIELILNIKVEMKTEFEFLSLMHVKICDQRGANRTWENSVSLLFKHIQLPIMLTTFYQ